MKPSTSTNILTKPWIKSQTKDYNFNLLEQTLKNKVNLPLNSIIMAIGTLLEIYKACATYNNKKDKTTEVSLYFCCTFFRQGRSEYTKSFEDSSGILKIYEPHLKVV